MARTKVAISLDESTLDRLDKLVRKQVFPNRSQAIEEAKGKGDKSNFLFRLSWSPACAGWTPPPLVPYEECKARHYPISNPYRRLIIGLIPFSCEEKTITGY